MSAAAARRAAWLAGLALLLTSPLHTLSAHAATPAPQTAPLAAPAASNAMAPSPVDPYLWLEDVQGSRALDWVRQHNAATRPVLEAQPGFSALRERIRTILDSKDRIPTVQRLGDHLYNFWRDEAHPRGLWRRTRPESFWQAEPVWETVLNLDQLATEEKENWVWKGANCLGGNSSRCLLTLSRGGADASVVREFDVRDRRFVAGGFSVPEAKSDLSWLDEQRVLIGTDTGPGSLTDSGYPRQIRLWQRSTPLAQAPVVLEARQTDVAAFARVEPSSGRVLLGRAPDFFSEQVWLWQDGQNRELIKPEDAELSFFHRWALMQLRSDWSTGGRTWPKGSLLVSDAGAYLDGKAQWQALFTPTATRSLADVAPTGERLLLTVLDQVAHRVEAWQPPSDSAASSGSWTGRVLQTPFPGTLHVKTLADARLKNDALAETFVLGYTDFLTPDSLYRGRSDQLEVQRIKSRQAGFDATGMRVEQAFARSKDGTSVPYFIVWPRGAKADGRNPTSLYGYGGFEVPLMPWYPAGYGSGWLERGGVLVVANIRGGGEFGPGWHQAALKSQRQRAFDDFIAVAEDLIARGVTSPRHLGIHGGSNGGLLVGSVMVQRPELFNAVICEVPLLDMRRYHTLLAGASWMGEYGDPDDPAQWAYISAYSPYHNVKPGVRYPEVFFVTSTRDDRVHPAHARKMAARMLEQGHEVLYFENIEGGHGASANNFQTADRQALEFAYLWRQLGPRP